MDYITTIMNENQYLYLPGWLNPAENLRPIATLVGGGATFLDLPSDKVRTVPEMADWVAEKIVAPVWIVGHSFGGKVAIAIAAQHPEKVRGIFVVAGSNRGRLIFRLLRPFIKIARLVTPLGIRRWFRAADYENSDPIMKRVMAETLRFNIIPLARRSRLRGNGNKLLSAFIYGAMDRVTRPALGQQLARAANGKFYELAGFNHNSIISDGAYQVSAIIKSITNV